MASNCSTKGSHSVNAKSLIVAEPVLKQEISATIGGLRRTLSTQLPPCRLREDWRHGRLRGDSGAFSVVMIENIGFVEDPFRLYKPPKFFMIYQVNYAKYIYSN